MVRSSGGGPVGAAERAGPIDDSFYLWREGALARSTAYRAGDGGAHKVRNLRPNIDVGKTHPWTSLGR